MPRRRKRKRQKLAPDENDAQKYLQQNEQLTKIVQSEKHELNFLEWHYAISRAYKSLREATVDATAKDCLTTHFPAYFSAVLTTCASYADHSLCIVDAPQYIASIAKFFILNEDFTAVNAIIQSDILKKFVRSDSFASALVAVRDVYVTRWYDEMTIHSPLCDYQEYLFQRNAKNQTFWYVYISNFDIDSEEGNTTDLRESLLMLDPLINETVVVNNTTDNSLESVSIFRHIARHEQYELLTVLMTRLDLEITLRSVEDSNSDADCLHLVRARYASRRGACKILFNLFSLLQGISPLQTLVLDFLL